MALKYADFCTRCGERRTKHPSKMCAVCRREVEKLERKANTQSRTVCKQCGRRLSNGEDGLCSICRQGNVRGSMDFEQKLKKAIKREKDRLFVLERRLDGNSFSTISDMSGIPVSRVYRYYADAMGIKSTGDFTDYIDGNVIQMELAEEDTDEQETTQV